MVQEERWKKTQEERQLYRTRGFYPGQIRDEKLRFDPYHMYFWHKTSDGFWEPETFAVLDKWLDKDHDYIDIGAWIGPTVLFGARKARHVWCFEPDPAAFRYLAWNLELNDLSNVSAFAVALSDRFGMVRMASLGGEAGDSMTSLLKTTGDTAFDAFAIDWNQFAGSTDLSDVSLVKMDIEGGEYSVLPTLVPWLRQNRPALHLSTHAPFLDEAERASKMAALVAELDFYGSCHDEAGQPVSIEHFTSDDALSRHRSFLFSG